MEIGLGRGDKRIHIRARRIDGFAIFGQTHSHLRLRINSAGDRVDVIEFQLRPLMRDDLADRLKQGIDRAIALDKGTFNLPFNLNLNARHMGTARAGIDLQRFEGVNLIAAGQFFIDKGDQVIVEDFFFAVSEVFEPVKGVLECVTAQLIPQLLQFRPERMPPGMFAQNQRGFIQTH